MSTFTGLGHQQQPVLAVPAREAARMLSYSLSKTYELLRNGELDSYSDGKARRVIRNCAPRLVSLRYG